MCQKDVRKFFIAGLDLVLQSQKITEKLGTEETGTEDDIRYEFHIFNRKGNLIGEFVLSKGREQKMLFEMSAADINEGRTTTYFINSCDIQNPSQTKRKINVKFQTFLRSKASLDSNVEIILHPKGQQSTYKLNGEEYVEPTLFTYNDFLDVFLAPINGVIIDGQKVEKTKIDEQSKKSFFFNGRVPKTSDELYELYNDTQGYNGRKFKETAEAVDEEKKRLKQYIDVEDLFPTDLHYILSHISNVPDDQIIEIREKNKKNGGVWKNSRFIYSEGAYSVIEDRIQGIVYGGKLTEFIPPGWVVALGSDKDIFKRNEKIDDLMVGMYFIALSNYGIENESYKLKNIRNNFVDNLKRFLKYLFDPDGGNPLEEIKEHLQTVQLLLSKKEISKEEGLDWIINSAIKLKLINENKLEQSHNVDSVKTK